MITINNMKNNKRFYKPVILMLFCLLIFLYAFGNKSSCTRQNNEGVLDQTIDTPVTFSDLLKFHSSNNQVLWKESAKAIFGNQRFGGKEAALGYCEFINYKYENELYCMNGNVWCMFSTKNINAKTLRVVINSESENLRLAQIYIEEMNSKEEVIDASNIALTDSKNGISDKTIDMRSAKYIKLTIEFFGNENHQKQYLLIKRIKMYADGKDLDSTRVILKRIKYYYE